MNILYVLLKNGTRLISQVEELTTVDVGVPDCKLSNPFVISSNNSILSEEYLKCIGVAGTTLKSWESDYTNDSDFIMRSDDILIMQKPKSELVKMYLKLLSDMINTTELSINVGVDNLPQVPDDAHPNR